MRRLLFCVVFLLACLAPPRLIAQDTTVAMSWHGPLVISTVRRITFLAGCGHFDIVNRGTTVQDVYVRFDGVDPIALRDPASVVAGNTMRNFATGNFNQPGGLTVRVISGAATPTSVECRLE